MLSATTSHSPSGAKSRAGVWLRHPQLIGVCLWAGAHLLVNGDMPSLVLFGGLLLWALAEIVLINRTPWTRPAIIPPLRKEITVPLAALVVYGLAAWVHAA